MRIVGYALTSISSLWSAIVVTGILLNGVGLSGCGFKPRALDLPETAPEEATALVNTSAKLAFLVQPVDSIRGTAIAQAIKVVVQDKDGNTVTTSKAKITLAIGNNPGGGTLSGTGGTAGTVTIEAASGVATFSDLAIDRSGVGYTLAASTDSINSSTNLVLTPATSDAFRITGPPAKLAFITQPSNTVAGVAINPAVAVEVQDSDGLKVTSAFPTIQLAFAGGKNPGPGTLSGTTSQTSLLGLSSFSGLTIQKAATGYALSAASEGLTSAMSTDFDILPSNPTRLAFEVEPTNAVAGVAISPAVKIIAQDQFGNIVSSFSDPIALTIGTNPSGGTLYGTASKTAVTGAATYSDLSIRKAATGYTLVASANGLTPATSALFNISPNIATKLAFIVEPTETVATSLIQPAPSVEVRDEFDNRVTGSSAAIAIEIGTNAGNPSGTLSGTLSKNALNGLASFSDFSINRAGVGYTLKALSSNFTNAISASFNIIASGATKLVFIREPTNAVAGDSIAPAVTVAVQDPNGNTITTSSATITLAIANNAGPGGVLSGTASVQVVNGVATFSNLSINKTGVGYTLSATSSPLTAATSAAFNITPGPATKLGFIVEPTNTKAAATITPAVKVAIQDQFGNTVPGSNGTIDVAIANNAGPGGVLSGTASVNTSDGVATFANLSINKTGVGYTLSATSNNLTSATSAAFNITADNATKLAFVVEPSTTVAGVVINPNVKVAIQDAQGNTVSNAANSITITIHTNPGGGTLGGTKIITASEGIAIFSTINIDKIGTGYKLIVSSDGLTPATSAAFDITAASAAKLAFSVQPIDTMANSTIAPAVEVSVQDQFGNLVSVATHTITLAIETNPPTNGILSGTKIVTATVGKSLFNNLSIDQVGAGYTIKATADGLTAAISALFNITAGVPAKLVITTHPSSTTAGSPLTLVAAIQDVNGNVVTSSQLAVTADIETNPASGTLSGTNTVNTSIGVATFATLSINKPGVGYTITVGSGALTPATTNPFNITVGPPAKLAWTAGSTAIQTNTCEPYTIESQDSGGNVSPLVASAKDIAVTGQGSGKFYSDSQCASPLSKDGSGNYYKTLSVDSSSITIYYKAPFGGNRTFLADDGAGGLTAATLNVSVANSMVLAANGSTTCVSVNGALRCWGDNTYGQLGDGTTTVRRMPVQVSGLNTGVTDVQMGSYHACAVQDGAAKCWGMGYSYTLGTGNQNNSYIPVQVNGFTSGVSRVAVGDYLTGLIQNGSAYGWGNNGNDRGYDFYNTGTNTTPYLQIISNPTQVFGLASGVSELGKARCAVHNGAAKCWGYQGAFLGGGAVVNRGILGIGNVETKAVPTQVSGLTSGVTQVTIGSDHACAVVAGGVKCWGQNNYGKLGDGTSAAERLTPVDVSGINSGATKVVLNTSNTCALVNGGVKCWGSNGQGQLGINTSGVATSNTPQQVLGLTNGVKDIAAGLYHACAVKGDDSIWCWGYNSYGQLGDNSTTTRWAPVQVSGLGTNVASSLVFSVQPVNTPAGSLLNIQVAIQDDFGNTVAAASGNVTLAIYSDPNRGDSVLSGTKTVTSVDGVATFSDLYIDQMGSGFTLIATAPEYFSSSSDSFNIVGGAASKLVWDAPSSIDASTCNKFTIKSTDSSANAANLGANTTIALSGLGAGGFYSDLLCTTPLGVNGSGYPLATIISGSNLVDVYFKDDAHENLNLQINASGLAGATLTLRVSYASKITTDYQSSCATINGALKCWGYNNYGQLGDNSIINRSIAVPVSGLNTGVTDVEMGTYHACAVQDGAAKCWGMGYYYTLGTGNQNNSYIPIQVNGFTSGVSRVAVGDYLTGLIQNGSAYGWGNNGNDRGHDFYNTGTNTTPYSQVISNPTQVYGLDSGVSELGKARCAVHNGAAKCWGYQGAFLGGGALVNSGILGIGNHDTKSVPTQVSGLTSRVAQVTIGSDHACAVVAGAVKCWGQNDYGKLGDGTGAERLTPVDVSGIYSGATKVALGYYHTCALVNGGVKCWGYNGFGQLGNNTTATSYTPVAVSGLMSGVKDVSAGLHKSCAIKDDDTVWCWGYNYYGQLGNNSTTNSSVPVQVQGLAAGSASKLAWVQGAASNLAGTCTGVYQVAVQDSSGTPSSIGASIQISFTGRGGSTIYSDSTCTTPLPTDGSDNPYITISSGFAYSNPIYFKDPVWHSINVTATSTGLASASKSIEFTQE